MRNFALKLSTILFLLYPGVTLAQPTTFQSRLTNIQFNPILSLGGGMLHKPTNSTSYFPADNPTQDFFYNYHGDTNYQNVALFDIFLADQWWITPLLSAQAGFEYVQSNSIQQKGVLTQGVDNQSSDNFAYKYNVVSRQLLLTGKLFYQIAPRWYPFIMGGMGWAFNSASDFSTTVPPYLMTTKEFTGNTASSFTYSVGVGMDFEFTKTLRFGLGYRYANLGRITLGSPTLDAQASSGRISQNATYANELVAQFTYIFGSQGYRGEYDDWKNS
jgi:opacity protein-like surface antigen